VFDAIQYGLNTSITSPLRSASKLRAARRSLGSRLKSLAPDDCGQCHADQFNQWRTSRHAQAFSPGLVGQLLTFDTSDTAECLQCHAPLAEQRTAFEAAGAPSVERVVAVVRSELATNFKATIAETFPVAGTWARRGELARRAWNARVPGRSGDLLVVPRYGVLVGAYGGKGSGHGTPWEYDTHVPLIFWGGGALASSRSNRVTPYDLAPTLGSWLGVGLPDATGQRIDVWDRR